MVTGFRNSDVAGEGVRVGSVRTPTLLVTGRPRKGRIATPGTRVIGITKPGTAETIPAVTVWDGWMPRAVSSRSVIRRTELASVKEIWIEKRTIRDDNPESEQI